MFPGRPVMAMHKPLVRTRFVRAVILLAVGRRDLVTAGYGHVMETTRNEPIVRFNSEHTRNCSKTVCKTETTCVNNTSKATYAVSSGLFVIPTLNAVTRD